MIKPNINDNELKVLQVLAEAYEPEEWGAYDFASLAKITKIDDRKIVRRACRSLARKGLAVFERTLWNDDGPAGAGYRASEEGAAFIDPCDICSKRSVYDYYLDRNGKEVWRSADGARHVRECEEHFKQSAALKQSKQEALI